MHIIKNKNYKLTMLILDLYDQHKERIWPHETTLPHYDIVIKYPLFKIYHQLQEAIETNNQEIISAILKSPHDFSFRPLDTYDSIGGLAIRHGYTQIYDNHHFDPNAYHLSIKITNIFVHCRNIQHSILTMSMMYYLLLHLLVVHKIQQLLLNF